MSRDDAGVIGAIRSNPGPAVAIAALASLGCGIGLAFWPIATSAALVTAIAVSLLLLSGRQGVIKVFLLFLLIQDLLQVLAGGDTALAIIIKRADEPMVLILGGFCIAFSSSVQRGFQTRGLLVAIAVCYAGLILSSIPPRSGTVPALLDFALFSKPFCLFAVGLSMVPNDDEIERAIRPLLVILLVVIAFGLVFLFAPQLQDAYIGAVRAPDERLGLLSAQGYFIGPGTFSWVAAATFALAYAAYLAYSRTFYLVGSLIAACFVVLSWRRKSILVVLTILLVSLLVQTSRRSRARAVAVVALSVAVILTVLTPYAVGLWQNTLREYGSGNPNASARSALYYTSVLIARDHFPLGTGLATFGSHASKLFYSAVYVEYGISQVYGLSPTEANFITDTFWPMVLGEGGVISAVALASFFWILLAASWRAVRRIDRSPTESFVSLAALFLLTGSLIESTASHIYGSSLLAAFALIPAGIFWERERRRATAVSTPA
jgi:hypothetical protein